MEESVRFAIAAASLKVTQPGLKMFPIKEIKAVANKLRVERMVYRDNKFFEMNKLFSQAQKNPLVKGSKKFAQKLLPKKKTERNKIMRSLVE